MTIVIDDAERPLLAIEEDDSVGNSIEFKPVGNGMYVEIDNPWSGDTETGFGRTAYISIARADAARLGEFLVAWSKT